MDEAPQAALGLKRKIAARSLRVAVIGLGYVGLPLATAFAAEGFHVTGIDIDQQKVEQAARGESYISAISNEILHELIEERLLHFTSFFAALDDVDAICMCVPTPLLKRRSPDISSIISAVQQVRAHLHPGQLVVLESTTYPGTTTELLQPILEKSGLRAGKDFFLSFSPEREDPGNKHFHLSNTPKVVGVITAVCGELTALLYGQVVDRVVKVSSAEAAGPSYEALAEKRDRLLALA